MKTYQKSGNLFERAKSMIPGGVNSPVRACRSVGMSPVFIEKAAGSKLIDADGNEYIDYIGSWGPMILGHSHPSVISAIEQVLKRGTSFGAPVDLEVELAEMIINAVPSVEKVRMVNSGTEATMSAIRVARGVTGRNTIVKFDGCYHGHADSFLVAAGSGVATLGIAGSPGVPEAVIAHTLSLPYNDIETFTSVMEKSGGSIAAVIVEPVAGNMGLVPPAKGFLEILRKETAKHGSLLIFDEVMTGFRVSYGGAQTLYNIDPDMSCFGKIVGGGLPVGAYGGKENIMSQVAPEGPVYQAGTLSGNPIAMAAGIAILKEIKKPGFYEALEKSSSRLAQGLEQAAANTGTKAVLNRVGSMVGLFLTDQPVANFDDAKTSDLDKFAAYYRKMFERGIYLAPSQFEALFISAAHSDQDIDDTIFAAEEVLTELGNI
ncbi:MAG: glutamate-1-semialdehyde 2,1-aminomutase [Desulfobacteraceae bacterium]|nr:glutamate-1-semialdehyde 2,1-aminomutase [Desulfobacteraceae bacterium]MBC2754212.1 glutamate-1-semialdehyde 2,1-aminomutase [Desulfobacteraceae bacterium]